MAKRLDDLLRGLGVNPDQGPGPKSPSKGERYSPSGSDLPPRFLQLLKRDVELRGMFDGQSADNPDRTPSGKDMVLGHRCRRLGFTQDEVRKILRGAPYPVDGGRTEDYLDRTVKAIFTRMPTQARGRSRNIGDGFGMLPARLLDGTWAVLSLKAAKVYCVMTIRCMRPSGIVRDGHTKLAQWAGISPDSVGPAVRELEAEGLIRRAWRWRGVNYWVNDLTCTGENAAHVVPKGAEDADAGVEGEAWSDPAPTSNSTSVVSSAHVNEATPLLSPEQVVLVMNGSGDQSAGHPADSLIRRDETPVDERSGAVPTTGRCRALTKARLECGLQAVPGERFCRWHQPKEKTQCVPAV